MGLEPIAATILGTTINKVFESKRERKMFVEDAQTFLTKQKPETRLVLFGFARDPKIKDDGDYLPLQNIYVPLRTKVPHPKYHKNMGAFERQMQKYRKQEMGIGDLFDELNSKDGLKKILLTGVGGCGKSTFLKYLSKVFNTPNPQFKRVVLKNDKVKEKTFSTGNHYYPIFIRLRDLPRQLEERNQKNWKGNFSFIEFFEYKYGIKDFQTQHFYRYLFGNAPCLFLIDGLDEIAEEQQLKNNIILKRSEVGDWLETQVKIWEDKNPFARFIMTGRPEVTQNPKLRRVFEVFEIQDFNTDEKQIFTEYWYREYQKRLTENIQDLPEDAVRFQKKLENLPKRKQVFTKEILNSDKFVDLLEKPLLLSLVLMSYSIDATMVEKSVEEIYEYFILVMIFQWDNIREINVFFEKLDFKEVDIRNILSSIAFAFAKTGKYVLPLSDFKEGLEKAIGAILHRLGKKEIQQKAHDFLRVIENRTGILHSPNGGKEEKKNYEFYHRQFQDFLAADYTLYKGNNKKIFNGHFPFMEYLSEDSWRSFFEFLVRIKTRDSSVFFADYILHLSSYIEAIRNERSVEFEQPYIDNLPSFVYYFLKIENASDIKDINNELIKNCQDLFLLSKNPLLILKGLIQLSKFQGFQVIPFFWNYFKNDDEKYLKGNNILKAFRKGRVALMLTETGKYSLIRPFILRKFQLFIEKGYLNQFWEIYHLVTLSIWQKDRELLKLQFSLITGKISMFTIVFLHALRDLLEIPPPKSIIKSSGDFDEYDFDEDEDEYDFDEDEDEYDFDEDEDEYDFDEDEDEYDFDEDEDYSYWSWELMQMRNIPEIGKILDLECLNFMRYLPILKNLKELRFTLDFMYLRDLKELQELHNLKYLQHSLKEQYLHSLQIIYKKAVNLTIQEGSSEIIAKSAQKNIKILENNTSIPWNKYPPLTTA